LTIDPGFFQWRITRHQPEKLPDAAFSPTNRVYAYPVLPGGTHPVDLIEDRLDPLL
jgi:hypothetical protein